MVSILDRHDGTLVGSFGGNGRYADSSTGSMRLQWTRKETSAQARWKTANGFRNLSRLTGEYRVDQAPQVTGSDGLTTS